MPSRSQRGGGASEADSVDDPVGIEDLDGVAVDDLDHLSSKGVGHEGGGQQEQDRGELEGDWAHRGSAAFLSEIHGGYHSESGSDFA